jgi:hypothetical protein
MLGMNYLGPTRFEPLLKRFSNAHELLKRRTSHGRMCFAYGYKFHVTLIEGPGLVWGGQSFFLHWARLG